MNVTLRIGKRSVALTPSFKPIFLKLFTNFPSKDGRYRDLLLTTVIPYYYVCSLLLLLFVSIFLILQQWGGSEDCLYLNVFTPNVLNNDQTSLKPVMVWIHGGGFTEGDASTLIDPEYLLDQDVVFVSIQYRLGLLGFLAVENSTDLTGNLGLKDQQEALRWVQRNIVFFGGDPAKVTIFGVSAGAVSVHSQVLSPSANGLFRAAILQSGTALFYYERIVHRTTEKKGSKVVEKLGCSNADDQLECLRLVEAEAFIDPELDAQVWPVQVTTDSTGMRNGKE